MRSLCGAVAAGLGLSILALLGFSVVAQAVKVAANINNIANLPTLFMLSSVTFFLRKSPRERFLHRSSRLLGPDISVVVWARIPAK